MNQTNQSSRNLLRKVFGRFRRKEDGVVTIDAILMLPMLFWAIWTMYTYFDGYRQSSRNLKATYALADILSRETREVTKQYISTLYDLHTAMIADRSDVSMRITLIRYDKPDGRHYVQWSCVRGAALGEWNDGNIKEVWDRIPAMANDSVMIIVESVDHYRRPFKTGFGDNELSINNFVFTQPRVFTQIRSTYPDC
ncbi:hypothetical protein HW561_03100 [Rhodobacteraceae bacterium B1Z28]|uniref:Flp pilus assembly protein TadG n=1 Tax=Ruegeria haliotis TaxID=2747601 RepID=A0ABX2PKX6_9RHOB|nr:hypothetical protein [Ruegeria haliotis]NVO54773.1 hypothetical protein [Ruegeria haliotis]